MRASLKASALTAFGVVKRNPPAPRTIGLLALAATTLAEPSFAFNVTTAPASAQQPALTVGYESGSVKAVACPQGPCDLRSAVGMEVPAGMRPPGVDLRMEVVPLGAERHAIWVRLGAADAPRAWEAVLTADPATGAVKTVFVGFTGWVQGEHGLRRGPVVQVSPRDATGARRIVVGEQHEDITLCGRPTVLAPQLLLPSDLALHPAKVQRLSREERAAAHRVQASRISGGTAQPDAAVPSPPAPSPVPSGSEILAPVLVRALAASSAVGLPGALTDGDPDTTWAENRGGAGRGEFVVMTASANLPLHALDVTIRPPTGTPARGVAPKEFWVATEKDLWHVTMPEDAWEYPGARYRIELGAPVQTGCLALVTESAWREGPDAQVTFAELAGISEFEEAGVAGLVGALAGGGDRAVAAAAVLAASGEPGQREVAARFDSLDEQGRRAALDVLDSAACAISAPAYVKALTGPYGAQRTHAKERLARCGQDAATALEAALGDRPSKRDPLLLVQLAMAAPARAVPAIVERLEGGKERRRLLRGAVSLAARREQGRQAVERVLRQNPNPEIALELLRALGPTLRDMRGLAEQHLERLSRERSFRTRYLVLKPAAELAAAGSARAQAMIASALATDESPYVRARAAQVLDVPSRYQSGLLQALRDPNVRVREAALQALASGRAAFASPLVVERLRSDPWPLVRVAAAQATTALPRDQGLDAILTDTLEDGAPTVQAATIRALAARGAANSAPELLDLLEGPEVDPTVRLAAAEALGRFCFAGATDALVDAALKLADPLAEQEARELGWAALGALTRLAPKDLHQRLSPLLGEGVPVRVREGVRTRLQRSGGCRAPGSRAALRRAGQGIDPG